MRLDVPGSRVRLRRSPLWGYDEPTQDEDGVRSDNRRIAIGRRHPR